MSININSEAACRTAYINYHCYGNSMGISAREMGEITQAWSDRLSSWQASVSSDENEYEFDDSDYANYKENGKEAAKEATGGAENDTGEKVKSYGYTAGTLATGTGMGLFAVATALAKKAGGKGCTIKPLAWAIAGAELALALSYWAIKPNKEGKEACDDLQTEMTGAQETLGETQEEMSAMGEEIMFLSDEALAVNEDANENIEEQKSEYDMYYESLTALKEKIDSGEPLTDSEKELYKEVIKCLGEIGVNIEKLGEDTTDEVAELYDEMGSYQDGYDEVAKTMGEIEGLTDYASEIDSSTQTQAYILGAALAANAAASGTVAGFLFADMNIFTKAVSAVFGGIAAGAAVSNAFAAKEQFEWAGQIGTEIDMRKKTQSLNSETMEKSDEEIDAYDGWMQGVEDLELKIPDDIEPVEDTALPTETPTGEDAVPDNLKPKKEKNEGEK